MFNFNKTLFVFLTLFTLLFFCKCEDQYQEIYVRFQWPYTDCIFHECPDFPDSLNYFIIHGIVTRNGSTPVKYCTTKEFNVTKIESIYYQLKAFSGDPYFFNAPEDLWKKFYEEYGTCLTDYLPTELDYFQKTLDIRNTYFIESWLRKAGIVPSDTHPYTYDQYKSTIESHIGKKVAVQCGSKPINGKIFMHVIGICYDDDFNPKDCSPETIEYEARACSDMDHMYLFKTNPTL
ncbi:ribonuclease t2 [Anaeramoeba flamelloides]|uniref:Ribonuclease t2 n=1 Tax=Anaeramoeba flamelloides TaxID=1746091 RepID=A0ABQ8XTM7_9EUKA|nr:ribonuclease t2 [Anaeramoeba flamelloides]